MFDWLKGLGDILDPEPHIAANATASGGTALLFISRGWWPLGTGEVITAPIAGFLVLWGVVALTSRLVRHVGLYQLERAIEAEKRRAIADHKAREPGEIERNLGTLGQLELAQLLWILHGGRQRVDLPVQYSLIEKHIFETVLDRNEHLVEVHPYVWAKREEIIHTYRNVRFGGSFPSGRA